MGVIYKNREDLESAIACYERCCAFFINFFANILDRRVTFSDLCTRLHRQVKFKYEQLLGFLPEVKSVLNMNGIPKFLLNQYFPAFSCFYH